MYPTFVRRTRNAKLNYSPSPQNKTRGFISLRFVENKYATRTMTTRPSRPVNLSIVKGYQIASQISDVLRSRDHATQQLRESTRALPAPFPKFGTRLRLTVPHPPRARPPCNKAG